MSSPVSSRCDTFASRQTPTHYDVLGLPADADADRIKNAFRQLALRHHPDKQQQQLQQQQQQSQKQQYQSLQPRKSSHCSTTAPGEFVKNSDNSVKLSSSSATSPCDPSLFREIQKAYDCLRDIDGKRKYDEALYVEALQRQSFRSKAIALHPADCQIVHVRLENVSTFTTVHDDALVPANILPWDHTDSHHNSPCRTNSPERNDHPPDHDLEDMAVIYMYHCRCGHVIDTSIAPTLRDSTHDVVTMGLTQDTAGMVPCVTTPVTRDPPVPGDRRSQNHHDHHSPLDDDDDDERKYDNLISCPGCSLVYDTTYLWDEDDEADDDH